MKIFYSVFVVILLQTSLAYGQPTLEALITQLRTQVKVIKYDGKIFTMETVEKWKSTSAGLTHHTILEFNSSESGRLSIDFCKVSCASIQGSGQSDPGEYFLISFTGNEAIERHGKTYKNCELILTRPLSTDSYTTDSENLILLLKYFCCN